MRSFPSLEIVRSVEPPPGEYWDCNAFFAGNMIVSALPGEEERFVAVDRRGRIADLDQYEAMYLVPGRTRHVAGSHPDHDLAPQDNAR